MSSNSFKIEERAILVEEYLRLRKSTGWPPVSRDQASKALSNDLFSACTTLEGRVIAIVRVIGDGAIYFYVQDLIVLPAYQQKGIGRQLMERVEHYLSNMATPGSFVGLMAAEGTRPFYERFGYRCRPAQRPGMFKITK